MVSFTVAPILGYVYIDFCVCVVCCAYVDFLCTTFNQV